jgi:phage shock protein A
MNKYNLSLAAFLGVAISSGYIFGFLTASWAYKLDEPQLNEYHDKLSSAIREVIEKTEDGNILDQYNHYRDVAYRLKELKTEASEAESNKKELYDRFITESENDLKTALPSLECQLANIYDPVMRQLASNNLEKIKELIDDNS